MESNILITIGTCLILIRERYNMAFNISKKIINGYFTTV